VKGIMGERYYFLMDLERTLQQEMPCFWLGNKHGYTYSLKEAGLFPKDLAEKIVKADRDNSTIMIDSKLVQKTKLLDLGTV
jgi:hypothetical protein